MKATGMRQTLHGSRLCRKPSVCAGAAPTAAGGWRAATVGTRAHGVSPPRSCRAAAEAGESMSKDTRTGEAWRAEWYNWWWTAANADALEVTTPGTGLLVSSFTGVNSAQEGARRVHWTCTHFCNIRQITQRTHSPLAKVGFGHSGRFLPLDSRASERAVLHATVYSPRSVPPTRECGPKEL